MWGVFKPWNYVFVQEICQIESVFYFLNVFKLQEKLSKEDKEHRRLKLKVELQEKATEAQIAEKTAGMVDEF